MDALPPPDSTLNMLDLIPDPEDDVPDEENIFRDMSFDEILEDLNARFLVNLPKEEMNLVRVYWQAEQA
jgi:mRNA-decapping enzyme subunit 2